MGYINTWGTYQCFQGIYDEEIYERDRVDFFEINPNGKIFNCIDIQGKYLLLQYGVKKFRVTNKLYRIVEEPMFKIGNKIELISTGIKAVIVDVNWHYKDAEPFYFIEIDEKRKSKRYTDRELRFF